MNLTMLLKFGENITAETPLGEKSIFGLQVVGIGMGVVFGVLLLLMAILQLFKIFALQKKVEEIKNEPAVSNAVSAPSSVSAPVTVVAVPDSEEEKIVAIATAAIAASRGESECAFNVISIKKIVK